MMHTMLFKLTSGLLLAGSLLACGAATEGVDSNSAHSDVGDAAPNTGQRKEDAKNAEEQVANNDIDEKADTPLKGAGESDGKENVTQFKLRFLDASVPPEYHRSYTISVDTTHVETVVDVYGDVIARSESPVTEAQWQELLNEVPGLPAHSPSAGDSVGGASTSLSVLRPEGALELTWDSRNDASDMKSAKSLAKELEALVPTLQAMKETAYP
jgi:hypothetical protein